MSPTWTISCTLGSALTALMNAGVALNSEVFGSAAAAADVSQYGESPYTASVNVLGLLPADDVAAAIPSTANTAPNAINLLMTLPFDRFLAASLCSPDATKCASMRGSLALVEVVTDWSHPDQRQPN